MFKLRQSRHLDSLDHTWHAWAVRFQGIRILFAASTLLLGLGLGEAAAEHHDVYVWQRVWRPAHGAALDQLSRYVGGLRVLAVSFDRSDAVSTTDLDLAALAAAQRPVILVARLEGSTPPVSAAQVASRLDAIAANWQTRGIKVVGVEVDCDVATAKLADYSRWLHALRRELPDSQRLSITALPTWIGATALLDVLNAVDESVLQVHSLDPQPGALFERDQALRWVRAFDRVAPKDYRVALPAYGTAVVRDDGRVVAVESETTSSVAASVQRQELRTSPREVEAFLAALRAAGTAPKCTGVVWFRLPLADDRRAWSLTTLNAVIDGSSLDERVSVELRPTGATATYDIVATNRGSLDTGMPSQVTVDGNGCVFADARSPYAVSGTLQHRAWRLDTPSATLPAGELRTIGWVRCQGEGTPRVAISD